MVKEETRPGSRVGILHIETRVSWQLIVDKGAKAIQRQRESSPRRAAEGVESEGKRLQRCGEHKRLLSLDAGWKARKAGTKEHEDQLPEVYA